jgi:hypothetical protein
MASKYYQNQRQRNTNFYNMVRIIRSSNTHDRTMWQFPMLAICLLTNEYLFSFFSFQKQKYRINQLGISKYTVKQGFGVLYIHYQLYKCV